VIPQFAQGIFVPLFFVPLFGLALGALSPADLAGGAGLLSFARTMAGAFASSISQTFWNNSARSGRVQLLNQFDSAKSLGMLHSGMGHARMLRQMENLV